MKNEHHSLIKAIVAFVLWGLLPVYLKLVEAVSPLEVLLYRIIFSLPCIVLYIFFRARVNEVIRTLLTKPKELPVLFSALTKQFYHTTLMYKKDLLWLALSGFLIVNSWFIFLVAVYVDKIIEISFAFFISALITIFGSLILFKEKLSRVKRIALVITFVAVIIKVINYGAFPFIATILAVSFSGYGIVKKHIQKAKDASVMFMLETSLFFPLSIITLFFIGGNAMVSAEHSLSLKLLLVGLGVVTVAPLLLFNQSVQNLDLSRVGFIQYLAPSISFILAIGFYKEPFTLRDLFVFILIWTALFIIGFEDYKDARKKRRSQIQKTAQPL